MDQIEKSNLSRQFLFRNSDIGCAKSTTAVRAVAAMNPHLHAVGYENKVAPETEVRGLLLHRHAVRFHPHTSLSSKPYIPSRVSLI